MSEKDMLKRIEELEKTADIVAIQQLRASYSRCADAVGYPEEKRYELAKKFANNFTEDGVFDTGTFGTFTGRQAIADAVVSGVWKSFLHIVGNGIIEVNGDEAHGQWSAIYPFVPEASDNFGIGGAIYEDTYVRTEDGWKFKLVKGIPLFFTEEWFKIMGLKREDATYAIAEF